MGWECEVTDKMRLLRNHFVFFAFLVFCFLFFLPAPLRAEKTVVSVDGSLMLSSAYLWRGEKECNLHVNPNVALHWGGFTLETYSYLSLDGKYKEIDWDISYTIGDFSLHIADYYAHLADSPLGENYFTWEKGKTGHSDEVALIYQSSSIPLNVRWFTFFWGNWLPEDEGRPGKLSFSSFLELESYYDFKRFGKASLTLGFSVLKGAYTDYTKYFMPVHIGLTYEKSFDLGPVSIPLRVGIVYNPYRKTCLAEAAFGFAF